MRIASAIFRFFASFDLAVVVLLLLALIVLLGTVSQKYIGLLDSQRKYFESWWVLQEIPALRMGETEVKIPLPGGALLMVLLFLNLLCGGLVRIRKKPQTIGVIIAHFSIMGLIVAGAVSWFYKIEGNLILYRKEWAEGASRPNQAGYFENSEIWQIEVVDATAAAQKKIPCIRHAEFDDCTGGRSRTFFSKDLPFQIKVVNYLDFCFPYPSGDPRLAKDAVILGDWALSPMKKEKADVPDLPGVEVEVLDDSGKVLLHTLLHGEARLPACFAVGSREYGLRLARPRWDLPFELRLNKFVAEFYEGTEKAKRYESHVTRIDKSGREAPHLIHMNHPLFYEGYKIYQSNYGPMGATGDDIQYTGLVVAKNPSDLWPLWCLVVATVGLLYHFIYKLTGFLDRKGAAALASSAGESESPPKAAQP